MPSNKKPRKRYAGPKCRISKAMLRHDFRAEIAAMFTKTDLITEIKLPRGTVNFDEIAIIRDSINLGTWLIVWMKQTNDLNPKWLIENNREFVEAKDSFHSLYQRGINAGAINNADYKFICTSDELNGTRRAVELAHEIVNWMIENRPQHLVKLFFAMKEFLDRAGPGRINVHELEMRKIMRGL